MQKGKCFVFSAPSGAGKTSLARALIARRGDIQFSVSHTTRSPRPGEVDGEDYFFVDRTDFEEMAAHSLFLEYAEVFGHFYGTSYEAVKRSLEAGRHVVLDIDWQGAQQVHLQMPESILVFILPPSLTALEARLRGRGSDNEEIISRRMAAVIDEMSHYNEFDHVVINDDFDQTLDRLDALISGEYVAGNPPQSRLDQLFAG